jgi:hypothetical protein
VSEVRTRDITSDFLSWVAPLSDGVESDDLVTIEQGNCFWKKKNQYNDLNFGDDERIQWNNILRSSGCPIN